jgi:hypothetical protein
MLVTGLPDTASTIRRNDRSLFVATLIFTTTKKILTRVIWITAATQVRHLHFLGNRGFGGRQELSRRID